MTAVNVFIDADACHVFTDGGHWHTSGLLVKIESKIRRIPAINSALMFCGPSDGLDIIHASITERYSDYQSAALALSGVSESASNGEPYSSILVSWSGQPVGIACQERWRRSDLHVGSSVKSLPTAIQFDPARVVESGVAMMEDQMARTGFVAGFCEYTKINRTGIRSQIVRRW